MKSTTEQHVKHLREMADYYRKSASEFDSAAEWFAQNGAKLEGMDVDHYGSFLNIKTPTRQDLMRVLKLFPGKWDKSVNYDNKATLNYSLVIENRPTINCVSAPPPPSCQIVEEIVEIPAQPARKELRKVVKCVPDVEKAEDELAAMAF